MEIEQEQYEGLCKHIEDFVGFKMQTRRDFDLLAERIFSSTRSFLSATTLRRFYGYQEAQSGVSLNTLNVLANFIGHGNWENYIKECKNQDSQSSDFICSPKTLVVDKLVYGDEICITWSPSRTLLVKYLGSDAFCVLESKNCKLHKDDTFHCKQFVEGMPLFCNDVLRPGCASMCYACGKESGIQFSLLPCNQR